jgi:hypothetical protein
MGNYKELSVLAPLLQERGWGEVLYFLPHPPGPLLLKEKGEL